MKINALVCEEGGVHSRLRKEVFFGEKLKSLARNRGEVNRFARDGSSPSIKIARSSELFLSIEGGFMIVEVV